MARNVPARISNYPDDLTAAALAYLALGHTHRWTAEQLRLDFPDAARYPVHQTLADWARAAADPSTEFVDRAHRLTAAADDLIAGQLDTIANLPPVVALEYLDTLAKLTRATAERIDKANRLKLDADRLHAATTAPNTPPAPFVVVLNYSPPPLPPAPEPMTIDAHAVHAD